MPESGPGDVITTFGGQTIANANALVQIVERTNPGTIPIQVTRNGRVRTIQADFPEFQVSEQRSLRQNLDVDSRTTFDADQELNVESRNQLEGGVQRTRPANEAPAPMPRRDTGDTGDIQRTPGTTPSYNPDSGSGYRSRPGLFRRRR
jgi:hypothetical protein